MERCQDKIERYPKGPYVDIDDTCLDDRSHSKQCYLGMEVFDHPCIRVEAEEAEYRLMRIPLRYLLKDCALRPQMADGLDTLQGFCNGSLIYDIK